GGRVKREAGRGTIGFNVVHRGGDGRVVRHWLRMGTSWPWRWGSASSTEAGDELALAMGQRGVPAWSSVRHTSPTDAPPHLTDLGRHQQGRGSSPAAQR